MGFRLWDYECDRCETRSEQLAEANHGELPKKHDEYACRTCRALTPHTRVISMPAKYTGERVSNPHIHGGSFDTMGHERMHDLPDLPGSAEHSTKFKQAMDAIPDGPLYQTDDKGFVQKDDKGNPKLTPIGEAHMDTRKKFGKTAPGLTDYDAHTHKPEYREIRKENERIHQRNLKKRQRAAALKRDPNLNMRTARCEGDPQL